MKIAPKLTALLAKIGKINCVANLCGGEHLKFQKHFFVHQKYTQIPIFMKIAPKLTSLLAKIGKNECGQPLWR